MYNFGLLYWLKKTLPQQNLVICGVSAKKRRGKKKKKRKYIPESVIGRGDIILQNFVSQISS